LQENVKDRERRVQKICSMGKRVRGPYRESFYQTFTRGMKRGKDQPVRKSVTKGKKEEKLFNPSWFASYSRPFEKNLGGGNGKKEEKKKKALITMIGALLPVNSALRGGGHPKGQKDG